MRSIIKDSNENITDINETQEFNDTLHYITTERIVCLFDFFGVDLSGSFDSLFIKLDQINLLQIDSLENLPQIDTVMIHHYIGNKIDTTKPAEYKLSLFRNVSFCNVMCGLNINLSKDSNTYVIDQMTFLTSQRGKEVHNSFFDGLFSYYGAPQRKDIVNIEKGKAYYNWYTNKVSISTRYQNNKLWGWKIIFGL